MCGIVGYVGKEQAAPIILDGLSKLEYRGYDSAGMAIYDGKNIRIEKSVGRLKVLEELTHGLNLIRFQKENDTCWLLIGCGAEPYFEAQLSFENVIVEWDAFKGPAWYVLRARGLPG